jgi:hypothetical protein
MRFYLGTHHDSWLGRVDVPLCVSFRRLAPRRSLPRACAPWLLDSGGFSELSLHGRWTVDPALYAWNVERIIRGVGHCAAVAIQDWMCEPFMLARTGLSIAEHQRRTVASYQTLATLAPTVPWMPVLQGWHEADYHAHARMYADAGVDLTTLPLVGVGSVCRRQATSEAVAILRGLASLGLRLHGFGFKLTGMAAAAPSLASADSLAWSFAARRKPPLPGHETRHKNCANCLDYALGWRARVVALIEGAKPMTSVTVSVTLAECEAEIEQNLGGWMAVALALRAIKTMELWRETGATSYSDYLTVRWPWSRQHAYLLTSASEYVEADPQLSYAYDTEGVVPSLNEVQRRRAAERPKRAQVQTLQAQARTELMAAISAERADLLNRQDEHAIRGMVRRLTDDKELAALLHMDPTIVYMACSNALIDKLELMVKLLSEWTAKVVYADRREA